MDITAPRREQIEQLFGHDEAVEAIKMRHESKPAPADAGYTKVKRSARQEYIERANTFLEQVRRSRDHYQLLNLTRNAPHDEVRAAYRKITKRYHPDQFVRTVPEEVHAELDKAFQKVTGAYSTLRDEEKRAVYDTSIGNYSNPKAQRAAMPHVRLQRKFTEAYKSIVSSRSPQVELLIEAADQELEVESYGIALSKLKLAQALDPLNPQIRAKMKEVKETDGALVPSNSLSCKRLACSLQPTRRI